MTNTFKVLGQSNPAATTLVTLYTVPGATNAVASSIMICNQSAGDATFRVSVAVAGAANTAKQYLVYDATILGGDAISMTLGMTLAASDEVRVFGSISGLSYNLFGEEIT